MMRRVFSVLLAVLLIAGDFRPLIAQGNVAVTSSALPSGAATSANQTTTIASLATIDGRVDGIETLLTAIDGHIDAFETIFGTASLLTTTQADNLADTLDGFNTTNFTYVYDSGGGNWDRWTGAVTCSNCSGSGASLVDDAAFVIATSSIAPSGYLADQSSPDSVNEGDIGAPRMTLARIALGTIWDAAGNERGANVNASNELLVALSSVPSHAVTATNLDVQIGGSDTVTVTATNLDVQIGGSDTLSVNPGTAANWGVYVEDAAETAGGNLQMVGTVRRDTAAASATTTGDNATLNTDNTGLLWVRIGASDVSSAGGTSLADDADFTDGTTSGTPIGGVAEAASPSTVTEGDFGWAAITLNRALKVSLFDASGNALTPSADWTIGSAIATTAPGTLAVYADFDGSAIPTITNVDTEGEGVPIAASIKGVQYMMLVSEDGSLQYGTSTTPLVVGDGSGALNIICDSGCSGGTQYAEDAVHASGNTGTLALVVRNDAGTALAADGDNIPLMVNSAGALYVAPTGTFTVSATNLDVQIGGSDTLSVNPGTAANWGVYVEDAAETAGGNLQMVGTVRRDSAASSATTTGDNATLNTDANGNLWVVGTVTVTDGAGALNVICDSGCSGGTQYAEDAVHASGNTGTLALVVRNDAGTALAADGDNIPLMVNSAGSLYVAGTGTFTVSDGSGALNVIVDSGTLTTLTTVTTVATVTTLSQLGGVALPVEDAGETAAGVGIYAMGVRRDTQASSAGSTGDNTMLSFDATGNLWIASAVLEDVGETAANPLLGVGSVRRDVAASSAGTTGDNATFNTDSVGALWTRTTDPCSGPKTFKFINQTTGTQLFTGTASNRTYICHVDLITATAQNVALISGTGTVCATSSGEMMGGTTAATGWNFVANQGVAIGNGAGSVAKSDTDSDNVCLLQSSTGQISGVVAYVVAPN